MPRRTGAPTTHDGAPGIIGPSEQPGPAFLLIALGRILREEVERVLRAHDLTMRHLSGLGTSHGSRVYPTASSGRGRE